jgi:hypothetical protein
MSFKDRSVQMIDPTMGLYDVGTGKSLDVEKWVDLGVNEDGEPIGLAYTTASHGHLVQIRFGSGRCVYDLNSQMLLEDVDRIGRWLNMRGGDALKLILENADALKTV